MVGERVYTLIYFTVTSVISGMQIFDIPAVLTDGQGSPQKSIPASLLEAGRLEGCTELTIFHRLILPCILPGVCSMCIFNFVSSWNNYLTPLILLNQNTKYTMPVMAAMIKGLYRSDYGAMYLSVSMSVLPILVVYVFFSHFIINGITSGSVK